MRLHVWESLFKLSPEASMLPICPSQCAGVVMVAWCSLTLLQRPVHAPSGHTATSYVSVTHLTNRIVPLQVQGYLSNLLTGAVMQLTQLTALDVGLRDPAYTQARGNPVHPQAAYQLTMCGRLVKLNLTNQDVTGHWVGFVRLL